MCSASPVHAPQRLNLPVIANMLQPTEQKGLVVTYADTSSSARDASAAVRAGAARLLLDLGYAVLHELDLPGGRRADIAGLGRKGDFVIVEVKSGVPDFRADQKWRDYSEWCETFFFAVDDRFPKELIPDDVGLIVADAYGGAIVRPSDTTAMAPARRKSLTLRFARTAASRLERVDDAQPI